MLCLQATKQIDASVSNVAELEDKLVAAQRRIQKQTQEQEEAEAARAQQGLHLTALQQEIEALQAALERLKQDRQQVSIHLCTASFEFRHMLQLQQPG